MNYLGTSLAILGAAVCAALTGVGSSIGVAKAGQAAAGVASEDPSKYSKCLLLQLLPATQGIYGFAIAFMVFIKLNAFSELAQLSVGGGMGIFFACMPLAIAGLFSAIHQSKVAVSAIGMVAKRTEDFGKGMTMTALVETYALLGLLISFLVIY